MRYFKNKLSFLVIVSSGLNDEQSGTIEHVMNKGDRTPERTERKHNRKAN